MRLSLFTPESKVHKQRNVMRETDLRLARYSTRGVALSLVVFLVAMTLGEYRHENSTMLFVFAAGIIATTLIRGFFLLRFEAIYAHAPSRWRNIYFVITILSASWWGLMLAHVTYRLGLQHETPLLWLYTIAFFSSCSHVFSPYNRFYSLYLLVALLPCCLVALFSFRALDDVYGIIMLLLIVLLHRQGKGQGRAYWERLQANYDLTQRANALEAEKIFSESTLSNKDILFQNIVDELRTSSREIQTSLQMLKLADLPDQQQHLVTLTEDKGRQQLQILQNIYEYSQISRNELLLKNEVFDIRDTIEKAVTSISNQIYKKKNEIFVQFSTDFPVTVRGDAERIEQMLINIVRCALDYIEPGSLLLTINYVNEDENNGRLKIDLDIEHAIRNPEIEQQLNDAFKPHQAANMSQGLSLAIAKGLSNCMQGSTGAYYIESGLLRFWVSVNLPMVTPSNDSTQNISKLNGKRLLLFQPPKIIESEYKNSLEAWGFIVDIIYDYEDAIAVVKHSVNSSTAFDLIMIYTKIDDLEGVTLAKVIAEETSELVTPQLICITEAQSKLPTVQQLLISYPQVELIIKPIGYKALKQRFKQMLLHDAAPIQPSMAEDFLSGKQVLLLQNEEIDRTIAEVMLGKLGCEVTAVNSTDEALDQLKRKAFDAFISESHIKNINMKEFIESVKTIQQPMHKDGYELPVLGISNQEKYGEETHCLQSGMNYYIDPPLQIDDLRAILRRWIGRAIHMAEAS